MKPPKFVFASPELSGHLRAVASIEPERFTQELRKRSKPELLAALVDMHASLRAGGVLGAGSDEFRIPSSGVLARYEALPPGAERRAFREANRAELERDLGTSTPEPDRVNAAEADTIEEQYRALPAGAARKKFREKFAAFFKSNK